MTRVGGSLVVASFTSRSVLDEAGKVSSMFGLSMSIFFKWVTSLEISRSDDWGWMSEGIAKSLGMMSFWALDRASVSADSSQVALGSIVSIWHFLTFVAPSSEAAVRLPINDAIKSTNSFFLKGRSTTCLKKHASADSGKYGVRSLLRPIVMMHRSGRWKRLGSSFWSTGSRSGWRDISRMIASTSALSSIAER